MIYNQLLDSNSVDQWLEERGQNIFWTISNQYQKSMPGNSKSKSIFETRHHAILWGGIYQYMDIPLIQTFVKDLRSKPDFYTLFSRILWIAIEEYCIPKLAVERPAVLEICMDFYEKKYKNLEKNKAKDSADILEKSYYAEKIKQLPKDNQWLKDLIGDILTLAHKAENTMELLTGLEKIYKNYFVTESWIDKMAAHEEIAESAKHQATKYKPAEDTFIERQKGIAANEVFTEKIVDAEFNPNSYRGKASKEYLDKEREKSAKLGKSVKKNKQLDFEKVQIFFGDLFLTPAEIEKIEQKISTGRHQNKKLYVTTGNFSNIISEYQLRFLEEQRRINLEYYQAHYRECRRHIESLRSLLINVLLPDSQEEIYQAKYGKFQAAKAWRLEAVNDFKIFEHIQKNEIGNFVVEILLDGSGSQSERQKQVAMQGYIIAQALGLCHIPCRVSAYATFLDYTIFRIYKDFDSPLEQNKRIFDFFGTGMNRDGFAMRAMGEFFKKREEENKILIVLSDGKPNDVRVFKKEANKVDLSEYTGDLAVKDTAMEVRKLRLQGISVLGVFNGLEQDLAAQQKIYGHDFAYIKKIDQFSKIVGTYLKKELRQLM